MATKALDVVTIMHALSALDGKLRTTGWQVKNPQQRQIFDWLEQHRGLIAKITGLDALASSFWQELNRFLTDRKFDPMFEPFDPQQGLGVVSVLDKLVKWINGPGTIVPIHTVQGEKTGFELPATGANIFEAEGYKGSYLVELLTKTDDTLWLFVHKDDWFRAEDFDIALLSMDVQSKPRKRPTFQNGSQMYAGAKVPMLDFDIKPDISWLVGAETRTERGDLYFIAKAMQQFKMRMDETGARVKVATGILTLRAMSFGPTVFVIDRPFFGWWTQKGLDLPMAAFFADWDAMKRPSGSLEEL